MNALSREYSESAVLTLLIYLRSTFVRAQDTPKLTVGDLAREVEHLRQVQVAS